MNKVEMSPQETALEVLLTSSGSRGSKEHEGLRSTFARLGHLLRELGDVVVFLSGRVMAMDPCASCLLYTSPSPRD